MDNVSSSEQVRLLLPGSPTCLTLVTSRHMLGGLIAQDGALLLDLGLLESGEAVELIARVVGADRVAAEPEAAARIAELCGYLPLTLRIAAARLLTRPTWRLAGMELSLADERQRLDALEIEDTAVRAAFALSYAALSPAAAAAFRRLGLVPGQSFSVAATAALTGTSMSATEAVLQELCDAHLVVDLGTSVAASQYRFHDLLRLFAAERVEAEEDATAREAAIARLFSWYARSADTACQVIDPGRVRQPLEVDTHSGAPTPLFPDHQAALAWLDGERTNLRAVVERAYNNGILPFVWHVAEALWSFYTLRQQHADSDGVFQLGLSAARRAGERKAEAAMLNVLATMHVQRSPRRAIELLHEAKLIQEETGDQHALARTLNNIAAAFVYFNESEPAASHLEQGIAHIQQAITIYGEVGDRNGQGQSLNVLGALYNKVGRHNEATDCQLHSIAISREVGSRRGVLLGLLQLGLHYSSLGQHDDELPLYEEALQISRDIGDQALELQVQITLGLYHLNIGRYTDALAPSDGALRLSRELGDQALEAKTLITLGLCYDDMGRYADTLTCCDEALRLSREIGAQGLEVESLMQLGSSCDHLGQYAEALTYYGEAVPLCQELSALNDLGLIMDNSGLAYLKLGDRALAHKCWHAAVTYYAQTGSAKAHEVRAQMERWPL